MYQATFTVDDRLKSIVEHAAASPKMREFYGKVIGPSLFLVKDAGCYLMSAGDPWQPDPEAPPGVTKLLVKYAEGLDDSVPWDVICAACGGDDFSEPIDLAEIQAMIALGAKSIYFKWTESSLEMGYEDGK